MLADSISSSLGMSATMSAGERPDGARLENASLEIALNVIATERDALTNLEMLYRTNSLAQEGIGHAVTQLVKTIKRGGKLVVCGVGKSGKIGRKIEATMNSMGIQSVFLHPTEALHGDLGIIREVRACCCVMMSILALTSDPDRHPLVDFVLWPDTGAAPHAPAYTPGCAGHSHYFPHPPGHLSSSIVPATRHDYPVTCPHAYR
jgi:hypothetical protein